MLLETCIVCGSNNNKEAIRVHDHLVSHKLFIISACDDCGFQFVKNPPSEDEAMSFYETEEYIEHSDSSEGLINGIYHKARSWMLPYKYKMLHKLGRKAKILDVGTGTGYFLNYMKSRSYEVTGVEISKQARDFGIKTFGLDIQSPDDLMKADFPKGFGYASFWHVLEHIYEPRKVLKRVHQLLDDNGVLVVALPNNKSLDAKVYKEYWAAYDVPRHLWHWDKESFTKFAEGCGYKLVKTKMLPLDPFYNIIMSETYRKNKLGYILIPFVGALSLIQGWLKNGKASSIVYFLEKA